MPPSVPMFESSAEMRCVPRSMGLWKRRPRKRQLRTPERGQHEEVVREWQCPEAEERQQRKEDDDVDADEPIDSRVREQPPLIEQIADDERQDQIGEEIDKTCTDFIHDFPNFRNRYVRLS